MNDPSKNYSSEAKAMPSPDSSMSLRVRKRLRTQSLLYDTAVALFSEHGYKAVTVDDICAAADVARATFFRYFGTKAGLMAEFDRRIVVEIEETLQTTNTDAASRLSVIQVSMSKAWSQAHPSLRALGVDYLRNTRVSEMGHVVADIQDLATTMFADGLTSGELSSPLSPRCLAEMLVSNIRTAIYHAARTNQKTDLVVATRPVLDMMLNGLRTT